MISPRCKLVASKFLFYFLRPYQCVQKYTIFFQKLDWALIEFYLFSTQKHAKLCIFVIFLLKNVSKNSKFSNKTTYIHFMVACEEFWCVFDLLKYWFFVSGIDFETFQRFFRLRRVDDRYEIHAPSWELLLAEFNTPCIVVPEKSEMFVQQLFVLPLQVLKSHWKPLYGIGYQIHILKKF